MIQLKPSFIVRGQLKGAWLLLCSCQMVFIKQCLAELLTLFVRNRMPCSKISASWIVCLAATVEWLHPQINSYHLPRLLKVWVSLTPLNVSQRSPVVAVITHSLHTVGEYSNSKQKKNHTNMLSFVSVKRLNSLHV